MRILSVLASFGLLLGMTCTAEAAKGKKAKPITGTVTSVKPDSGKDTGSFIVKVTPKQKKGAPAPTGQPEEKTFKVTSSTTFESLTGKKKNTTSSPAKFSDLSDGQTVTVTATDDTATDVKTLPAKKKKKAK